MKKIIFGLSFSSAIALLAVSEDSVTAVNFTGSGTGVSFSTLDVGQTFYVDWANSEPVAVGGDPLGARARFTIAAFQASSSGTPGTLTLTTRIKNTTWLKNMTEAGLASMGFNFSPTSFVSTSNKKNKNSANVLLADVLLKQLDVAHDGGELDVFNGVGLDLNLPDIDNGIDVCAFAGNGCPGGGQKELLGPGNVGGYGGTGNNDLFELTIKGLFGSTVELNTFGVKWQTSKGSYKDVGTVRAPDQGPTTVPEPSTFWGSCLTMLGIVALTQKKRLFARSL